jgi:hypothetical protein
MAEGKIEPVGREADLLVSERVGIMDLAAELGLIDDELLARMTSRQYTRYRARALVKAAAAKVAQIGQR